MYQLISNDNVYTHMIVIANYDATSVVFLLQTGQHGINNVAVFVRDFDCNHSIDKWQQARRMEHRRRFH